MLKPTMPALKHVLLCFILLLCGMCLQAQVKQVKNYKVPFEKAYIHTDRGIYTAGDDIWFKAYLLNGQNNEPSVTSNNLYVELISAQAEIISRDIVRIDYSVGRGDFKLSDSIPSGRYRLRAYTNWMRNFGDNFVFEKNIDIVNTNIKKPDVPANVPVKKAAVSIRFFPEGGSLIEGVSALVAVKADDVLGKGIPVNGWIVTATGDTISTFKTDSVGMSLFTLLPLGGQVYHAVYLHKGKLLNADLPKPLVTGLNINIMRIDTLVNVIINTNDATLDLYKNKAFIITGKHTGTLCLRKPVQLIGSQTVLRIPKSFFPEGITILTLCDEQGKPYTERLIYIEHAEQRTRLDIVSDKPAYTSREKVTIKVKLNDTISKANLSMAVVDESLSPVPVESIQSYLMLTSELKGNIENPNRYFDTTNINRFKQMDMLMLTQGWRDFIWKRVADSAIRLTYLAENGFNIAGKVRQKLAKKPIPDVYITLTAFKAQGQKIFSAKTDSLGRYDFKNLQLYGPQQISLTARNARGNRAGWLLMDSITKEPLQIAFQPKVVVDTNLNIIKALNRREISLKKAAGVNMLKEVKITTNKTTVFRDAIGSTFGYPDQFFKITKKDEYFQALDNWMAHHIKGAILTDAPGVQFSGRGFKYTKNVYLYPKFIVNGQELVIPEPNDFSNQSDQQSLADVDEDRSTANQMMRPYWELTMDKIKTVELKHLVGTDLKNIMAIIDIYVLYLTITPDAFENKDFGLEKTDVKGYYEARTFYKPLYDIPADKNKPDLRTTIHWEPNIIVHKSQDAVVSFYNADPKSKIRIIVQGVTDKGVPVYSTLSYLVN